MLLNLLKIIRVQTVVCERGDSFRRPLPRKFRASSLHASASSEGSKHLSLGSPSARGSAPAFRTSFRSAGINVPRGQNVARETQGGPRINPRRADARCTCDDHFHKKRNRSQRYETRRYSFRPLFQNFSLRKVYVE
ncbi:hypothetical protein TNCV_68991 [Trichonephila clavipes]|nr:hypothetical protein TNCV_68991 [Trichonephila clavipes]